MPSKRERAEYWPSDTELFDAHRAQARGMLHLLKEQASRELSVPDKLRITGNYMLLSSFITPEPKELSMQAERIEREKLTYFTGMLAVGFRVIPAARNTENIYATKLRKMIYPLLHIPDGSPELIETRRNGRIVGRALDIEILCEQAHLLDKPNEED